MSFPLRALSRIQNKNLYTEPPKNSICLNQNTYSTHKIKLHETRIIYVEILSRFIHNNTGTQVSERKSYFLMTYFSRFHIKRHFTGFHNRINSVTELLSTLWTPKQPNCQDNFREFDKNINNSCVISREPSGRRINLSI